MKKIGIIMFNYPLGVSPSVINSAILFEKEGFEVNIFINRKSFCESPIDFKDKNISIHDIGYTPSILNRCVPLPRRGRVKQVPLGKILWSTISQLSLIRKDPRKITFKSNEIFRSWLKEITKDYLMDLYQFSSKVKNFIDSKYVCLIGVEANGLIVATIVSKQTGIEKNIPIIYYNLELLLEKECKSHKDKTLKIIERECNRRCFFTIIPDKRRGRHLIADNGIPEDKLIYVPVSGLGKVYKEKKDYLHKVLDIPKHKKIILYAGNIIPWSMCLEITEAAQKWNDDKVLVLHTWRTDLDKDRYMDKIKRLTKTQKVYLSLNPVEWSNLPELLSSADIGLIFYQRVGENFYETGSSSNKLAQYLQVGLPVITSDYPSFREVVKKYRCGKCTNYPEKIEKLANEILMNHREYRENAFKCYKERYEFSKHFKSVINRIRTMNESTG